jgi:DNA invertase Pin-like site-specific DNA recombinase
MAKIGYARVSSTDQDFDGQADRAVERIDLNAL